jgi:hypothetical protein
MQLEIKLDSDELKQAGVAHHLAQLIALCGGQLQIAEPEAKETAPPQKTTRRAKSTKKSTQRADKASGSKKKARSLKWKEQRRNRFLKLIKTRQEVSQSQVIAALIESHGYSEADLSPNVFKGFGASMSKYGTAFEGKRRGQGGEDPWYTTETRASAEGGAPELYYLWNPPPRSTRTAKSPSKTEVAPEAPSETSGEGADAVVQENPAPSEPLAAAEAIPLLSQKLTKAERDFQEKVVVKGRLKKNKTNTNAAQSLQEKYSAEEREPPFELQGDHWVYSGE